MPILDVTPLGAYMNAIDAANQRDRREGRKPARRRPTLFRGIARSAMSTIAAAFAQLSGSRTRRPGQVHMPSPQVSTR